MKSLQLEIILTELVPCSGVLQDEAHILLGSRIPFYLDSATTVFVACSDSAVKRSAWLIRRVAVLEEGVSHGIIQPLHINEYDMVADPYTKYLPDLLSMSMLDSHTMQITFAGLFPLVTRAVLDYSDVLVPGTKGGCAVPIPSVMHCTLTLASNAHNQLEQD